MTAIFDTVCPWCLRTNQLHSNPDGSTPEAGDLSICWRCRQLAVYNEDLTLRIPTKDEYEEAIKDPEVRKVLGLTLTTPTPDQAIKQWRASS